MNCTSYFIIGLINCRRIPRDINSNVAKGSRLLLLGFLFLRGCLLVFVLRSFLLTRGFAFVFSLLFIARLLLDNPLLQINVYVYGLIIIYFYKLISSF